MPYCSRRWWCHGSVLAARWKWLVRSWNSDPPVLCRRSIAVRTLSRANCFSRTPREYIFPLLVSPCYFPPARLALAQLCSQRRRFSTCSLLRWLDMHASLAQCPMELYFWSCGAGLVRNTNFNWTDVFVESNRGEGHSREGERRDDWKMCGSSGSANRRRSIRVG